ncbi:MAG TPA: histidine phosphatase family protein [Solirubrobacterales bacterium]
MLLAVRHGETTWSAEGRFTTDTDVPLTQAGWAQAEEMASVLAGLPVDFAYTSPLGRARKTAEVALSQAAIAHGPDIDDRLREAPAGPFEGHVLSSLRTGQDQLARAYQAYDAEADPSVPPGAEHPAVTARRLDDFLGLVERRPGRYVAFSHGKALRIMLCLLKGVSPLCHAQFRVPTGCAIGAIRTDGNWRIVDSQLRLAAPE